MITGKKPFEGENDDEIKEKILSRDLNWEEDTEGLDISAEAKDIITKLTMLIPYQRLGLGADGTHTDF